MMEFLNHLVAVHLMKDAERFERIEQLTHGNRLLGPVSTPPQSRPRTTASRDGQRTAARQSRSPCVPGDGSCQAGRVAR
jgi:hypothetical protein